MRLELEIIILIHHNSYYWEGGMNMDPAREQHQHARDAIRCSNSNWGSGVNFTPATLLSDQSWSLRGSNDRSSTDTLLVLNCWVCSALCRNLSHQIQWHTTIIGCYATVRYYGFFFHRHFLTVRNRILHDLPNTRSRFVSKPFA